MTNESDRFWNTVVGPLQDRGRLVLLTPAEAQTDVEAAGEVPLSADLIETLTARVVAAASSHDDEVLLDPAEFSDEVGTRQEKATVRADFQPRTTRLAPEASCDPAEDAQQGASRNGRQRRDRSPLMRTTTSVPHSQTVPPARRWRNPTKAVRWPLSAAAAVLLAAGLLALLVGKSASPAYAISQTLEALGKMRYVHVCLQNPDGTTGSEKWLELDEYGLVRRVRDEGKDSSGNLIVDVLTEDTRKEWKPNLNELRVSNTARQDRMRWTAYAETWLDPSRLLKLSEDLQVQGRVTIQTELPKVAGQPITVTVSPVKSGNKWILLIDPDTKLVLQQDRYEQENGRIQFDRRYVYLDYNRPIDPARFALDVPANAKVIDESEDMTGVGLAQETMTQAETATQVVRQYMDALLAKDYAKAASLSGNTAERLREWAEGGGSRIVRVILVGPAAIDSEFDRYGLHYYKVPFEYEVEWKDGRREIVGPAAPGAKDGGSGPIEHRAASVRQVPGYPDKWFVWAGI